MEWLEDAYGSGGKRYSWTIVILSCTVCCDDGRDRGLELRLKRLIPSRRRREIDMFEKNGENTNVERLKEDRGQNGEKIKDQVTFMRDWQEGWSDEGLEDGEHLQA